MSIFYDASSKPEVITEAHCFLALDTEFVFGATETRPMYECIMRIRRRRRRIVSRGEINSCSHQDETLRSFLDSEGVALAV